MGYRKQAVGTCCTVLGHGCYGYSLVFSQSLLSLDLIEDFLEHWEDLYSEDGQQPVSCSSSSLRIPTVMITIPCYRLPVVESGKRTSITSAWMDRPTPSIESIGRMFSTHLKIRGIFFIHKDFFAHDKHKKLFLSAEQDCSSYQHEQGAWERTWWVRIASSSSTHRGTLHTTHNPSSVCIASARRNPPTSTASLHRYCLARQVLMTSAVATVECFVVAGNDGGEDLRASSDEAVVVAASRRRAAGGAALHFR